MSQWPLSKKLLYKICKSLFVMSVPSQVPCERSLLLPSPGRQERHAAAKSIPAMPTNQILLPSLSFLLPMSFHLFLFAQSLEIFTKAKASCCITVFIRCEKPELPVASSAFLRLLLLFFFVPGIPPQNGVSK